jgi:hypothetical protein
MATFQNTVTIARPTQRPCCRNQMDSPLFKYLNG